MLKIKKHLVILLTLMMIFVYSGCNIMSAGTEDYVETVRQDMLQAVNMTRELKEQQKKLDARSVDDAKKCMDTLDNLDKVYSDMILLESPDKYDDLDDEIKQNSESSLSYIKALKSLITTAVNTGDDSLYKQESQHIMEQYEENYTALVDLGSQVTTRFRNG